MNNSEPESALEKFADRTIEGNYALWNALLTMNVIVFTVFTAAMTYAEHSVQPLLVPTVLLSVVSAGLVIANFRASRNNMKYQGELIMGLASRMSEKEKGADLVRAKRSHTWIVRRERAVVFVTFVQGVLIVALVGHVAWLCHAK